MSPRVSASEVFLRAQTDERLAALSCEGHGRAFAVLVDRHRRPLLGHACRMVGSERAEDVLQQALLKAWRSLQEGAQVRHAQAWLHRILHNAALTEIERQLQTADPLDEGLADSRSAAAAVEQRLEVREVLQGLASLPQRQRLALLGTELEGRSRRQLAAELGLSEGAVRQLVHRARARIRAAAAALVPFPLIDRVMRASGWVRGPVGASRLGPAAEAAGASGMLAGGVAKLATVVVAVGVVGGGVLVRAERGHAHPLNTSSHQITSAPIVPAATLLSLRDSGSALPENEGAATPAARLSRKDDPSAAVAQPRERPPGQPSDERRADRSSSELLLDGEAGPRDSQRTDSEGAPTRPPPDASSPTGSADESASAGESTAAKPSPQAGSSSAAAATKPT
jgi:RNA polymerase sigma factor (sigma-70 family)